MCEILDECLGFVRRHEKLKENRLDLKYKDYRDIDHNEKEKYDNGLVN